MNKLSCFSPIKSPPQTQIRLSYQRCSGDMHAQVRLSNTQLCTFACILSTYFFFWLCHKAQRDALKGHEGVVEGIHFSHRLLLTLLGNQEGITEGS